MKGAKVCVPAKAGWGYKAERASLVAVIDAIKSQSKKASAVKQQAQQQARRWRSGREGGGGGGGGRERAPSGGGTEAVGGRGEGEGCEQRGGTTGLGTGLSPSRCLLSASPPAAPAPQMSTAMNYLQLQSQQMQQIQAQYAGGQGGKWSLGAAYRPPDTNLRRLVA